MTITFDAATHTYSDEQGVVPGVTTILKPLEDFEHVSQDVLNAAADFGTNVHTAVEYLIAGTLDWKDLDPALEPYVKAADVWLAHVKPEIITTEMVVHHDQMRYAGTADMICWIRKRKLEHLTCVDWKSGAAIPKTVGPQTAAYCAAYTHMHCGLDQPRVTVERTCVLLTPTGRPKERPCTNPSDLGLFHSCLNLWKYKNG